MNDYQPPPSLAQGSAQEPDRLIEIACRLDYIEQGAAQEILAATAEVARMLRALAGSFRKTGGRS